MPARSSLCPYTTLFRSVPLARVFAFRGDGGGAVTLIAFLRDHLPPRLELRREFREWPRHDPRRYDAQSRHDQRRDGERSADPRSAEHTSELQSLAYLVCRRGHHSVPTRRSSDLSHLRSSSRSEAMVEAP